MIDVLLAASMRATEALVDAAARLAYIPVNAVFKDVDERKKRALAYAIVGDLIVSPIPSPLDAPLDVVINERIRENLPEYGRYRWMAVKAAEALPIIELLPTYTISVLSAMRESEAVTGSRKG